MSGLLNSLFGAGGGILAVSGIILRTDSRKTAQATALAATFTMSVISCGIYLYNGYFSLSQALVYLPFGVVGAVSGALLLKRMPDGLIGRLFGLFMLWCGARMVLR